MRIAAEFDDLADVEIRQLGDLLKNARVVGLFVTVYLFVEHIERVAGPVFAGEVDRDRVVVARFCRAEHAVAGDGAVRVHDHGGDLFILSGLRAAVADRPDVAVAAVGGRRKAAAAVVEHRQFPFASGILRQFLQTAVRFAALGGGCEEHFAQIEIKRGTHRDAVVVHVVAVRIQIAGIVDDRRTVVERALRAQPPVVGRSRRIHALSDRAAARYILRVHGKTAGVVRKPVCRVLHVVHGEQEHLVLRRIAAVGLHVGRQDSAELAGRKRIAHEVGGIVILVRRKVVEPFMHIARFPRRGSVSLVIEEHIQILIRKQEQLAVCVREHAPLDGINAVTVRFAAALFVAAEPDFALLRAEDVCRAAVFHKLDRFVRSLYLLRRDEIPVRGINVAAAGARVECVALVHDGRRDRLVHDAVVVAERGVGNSDRIRRIGVYHAVELDRRGVGNGLIVRTVCRSDVDFRRGFVRHALRFAAVGTGERRRRTAAIARPIPFGRVERMHVIEERI